MAGKQWIEPPKTYAKPSYIRVQPNKSRLEKEKKQKDIPPKKPDDETRIVQDTKKNGNLIWICDVTLVICHRWASLIRRYAQLSRYRFREKKNE